MGGRWVHPTFVKKVKLSIEKKRRAFCAGTQTTDGLWQKVREEAKNKTGGKPHQVCGFVGLAQFRHWTSGSDAMQMLGALMPAWDV
eukprot:1458146-Amphidinium_carterae.3